MACKAALDLSLVAGSFGSLFEVPHRLTSADGSVRKPGDKRAVESGVRFISLYVQYVSEVGYRKEVMVLTFSNIVVGQFGSVGDVECTTLKGEKQHTASKAVTIIRPSSSPNLVCVRQIRLKNWRRRIIIACNSFCQLSVVLVNRSRSRFFISVSKEGSPQVFLEKRPSVAPNIGSFWNSGK